MHGSDIVNYACSIWAFACKTNMNYLYRAHNKNLHIIRNGHRYLRNTPPSVEIIVLHHSKNVSVNYPKNFYKTVYFIPKQIVAMLPDYEVSDPRPS